MTTKQYNEEIKISYDDMNIKDLNAKIESSRNDIDRLNNKLEEASGKYKIAFDNFVTGDFERDTVDKLRISIDEVEIQIRNEREVLTMLLAERTKRSAELETAIKEAYQADVQKVDQNFLEFFEKELIPARNEFYKKVAELKKFDNNLRKVNGGYRNIWQQAGIAKRLYFDGLTTIPVMYKEPDYVRMDESRVMMVHENKLREIFNTGMVPDYVKDETTTNKGDE